MCWSLFFRVFGHGSIRRDKCSCKDSIKGWLPSRHLRIPMLSGDGLCSDWDPSKNTSAIHPRALQFQMYRRWVLFDRRPDLRDVIGAFDSALMTADICPTLTGIEGRCTSLTRAVRISRPSWTMTARLAPRQYWESFPPSSSHPCLWAHYHFVAQPSL